jgi:predicted NBD/HSP70 family sugar kinase
VVDAWVILRGGVGPDTRGRMAAGRPSVGVCATEHAHVLAVDVRVSGLVVARVGLGGRVPSQATGPSPHHHDPQATVTAIARLAREVLTDADPASVLVGIGVSVSGIIARDSQMVRLAPNLDRHDVQFAAMPTEGLGT